MNKTKRNSLPKIAFVFIGLMFLLSMFVEPNNKMTFNSAISKSIVSNESTDFQINSLPNETELEDFLDAVISAQRPYYLVPGVTVSVVKDNNLLFTKGYGYSNYSIFENVDANESIFRIGSISKTFTAVAALQLVEDGLLDLDTDINDYLTTFQIPDTFKDPITLRHLLTHTAGFEEYSYYHYFFEEAIPLEEIARVGLPERVTPPGLITGYSNYGFTLVGYLIEFISGMSFADYIKSEITDPLGMDHTSFEQPLPLDLQDNVSASYNIDGTEWPYHNFTLSPASCCGSTALDMSKFMMMLLNDGSYNGTQILQSETAQMMKAKQFLPHPNLPGVGFGLYDMDLNDVHIIGHGGAVPDFHSYMLLFPDENFGLFISYNSLGGALAREELAGIFIEVFFPYNKTIEPMNRYNKNLQQYTGRYLSSRRYYTEKEIYNPFINTTFTVTPHDFIDYYSFEITENNGYLRVVGLDLDFVQVEPDYFVEATGDYDLEFAFIRNNRGQVSHFCANFILSITTMEKMMIIHEGSDLVYYIMIPVGSLFFLALIWWLIEAIIKARRKEKATIFRIIPKILPLGFLISTALIIGLMPWKSNQIIFLEANMIAELRGMIILPILSIIFLTGMFASNFLVWFGIGNERKPYWNLLNRIFYSILTFLGLTFLWVVSYWNLLV